MPEVIRLTCRSVGTVRRVAIAASAGVTPAVCGAAGPPVVHVTGITEPFWHHIPLGVGPSSAENVGLCTAVLPPDHKTASATTTRHPCRGVQGFGAWLRARVRVLLKESGGATSMLCSGKCSTHSVGRAATDDRQRVLAREQLAQPSPRSAVCVVAARGLGGVSGHAGGPAEQEARGERTVTDSAVLSDPSPLFIQDAVTPTACPAAAEQLRSARRGSQ